MIFKSFRLKIIIRILCLTGGGALVAKGYISDNPVLLVAGLVLIIVGSIAIFTLFQSVNRKTAFFFDAIRNEDTTLSFSEKVPDKSVQLLHQSMNRVNERIKLWKRQMAYKERFYQELIEHSATGLVVFDDAGYVELINSTAKSYMGLHPKSNLKLLQQRSAVLHGLLLSLSPGKTETVRILVNDEPCFLSVSLTIIKFENKTFRLYSLKNIRQELDEKELDSWQKLIRVLTHEIMNSIAPITSLSKTISSFFSQQGKPVQPDEITRDDIKNTIEGLEIISERGAGLTRFVDSYRALTKVPDPVFANIDLERLLNKLLTLVDPVICKNKVRITISVKELKYIVADESLLMQAMLNIVKNSCEALESVSEPHIAIRSYIGSENKSCISFTDNGCGISEEIIDRIFVPFFTTKNNGSGIGLSICRQIMHKQNGTVTLKSVHGKGTTVTLLLF